MNRKEKKMEKDIPWEWHMYTTQTPVALEVVPYTLYATMHYISQVTTGLQFFQEHYKLSYTNMQIPGMLPNPQSFLIHSIRINGIASDLMFGVGRLQVGYKVMHDIPLYNFTMQQKGYKFFPYIMIAPLIHFNFEITWDRACALGPGLDGGYQWERKIQVCFHGQLARPIQ